MALKVQFGQGTDAEVTSKAIVPGYVYVTTDDSKLIYDDENGTRHTITSSTSGLENYRTSTDQDAIDARILAQIQTNANNITSTSTTAQTALQLAQTVQSDNTTLAAELAGKQDKLTAGDNITITSNSVISSTSNGVDWQSI